MIPPPNEYVRIHDNKTMISCTTKVTEMNMAMVTVTSTTTIFMQCTSPIIYK